MLDFVTGDSFFRGTSCYGLQLYIGALKLCSHVISKLLGALRQAVGPHEGRGAPENGAGVDELLN